MLSRFRATYFSLLVQRKVGKRKHTPSSRPALRAGFVTGAGFSEGTSMSLPETHGIHAVRPSGLIRAGHRCGWGTIDQDQMRALCAQKRGSGAVFGAEPVESRFRGSVRIRKS
jgi:hypothetical protein